MIELKAVPHDTNLAHTTITRLGDDRSTRYRVLPSEARPAGEERATAPILTGEDIHNNYERWKNVNVNVT
jgi:hypothetical protein